MSDAVDIVVRSGDTIRFSAELLREMTRPDYPVVRVVEVRLASDGSKVVVLEHIHQ